MYIESEKLMTIQLLNPKLIGRKLLVFFKWLIISILILLLIAFALESYFKHQDKQDFPAPGKLYLVNGHQMHLWCEGSGEPTIVLDSGASMFSSGWRWVMPELASHTRVCAFDRSGLGWSEKAPEPYDGVSAAGELHQLLQQAEIQSPFIYVGHSLGANMGQIYYRQYPSELSALVLLEPADPAIFLREVGEDKGKIITRGQPIKDCALRCMMMNFVSGIGVTRVAFNQIEVLNDPFFHSQALAEYKARMNRSESLTFLAQRGRYINEIMFQTADNKDFANLPIAMFHSENSGELLGASSNPAELIKGRQESLNAYKKTLMLSSRSLGLTQINNANHLSMVTYEEPAKQVSQRIIEILAEVRNQPIASSNHNNLTGE